MSFMAADVPHFGEDCQPRSAPQWAATCVERRGNVPAMGNNLKKLREKMGWTHQQAADAMGISRSSFIKLERGERRLTSAYIARAAEVFSVPASAVFSDRTSVPLMGFIGAGASIEPEFEQVPDAGLETVELPFPVPDAMIAFQVKGDSMMPRYDDGDVVVVWRDQRKSIESLVGKEAAVRTDDGRRFLKTISPGPTRGTFTLGSFNARPIPGVKLVWVGEIYVTVRADQLRGTNHGFRRVTRKRAVNA